MALTRSILTIQDLSSDDFSYVGGKLRITFPDSPLTSLVVGPGTTELTYTDELGAANIIDLLPLIQAGETTTSIAYDGTTGVLTYNDEDGTATAMNLPLENFLSAAAYDDTTNILTLTLDDGTTVPVDLSELVEIYALQVTDGQSVDLTLSGAGTAADPRDITAEVIYSADANNAASAGTDGGVFVKAFECADLGTCPMSSLSNVSTTTDAPANDCDVLSWDATAGEWSSMDMSSVLNSAALTP